MIELQNFERRLDPRAPEGSDIADRYMTLMLERCQKLLGKVFVAETAGLVVGYVSIWARVKNDEPDAAPKEHGLVSDLVVLPQYRGQGIGRKLLARAEAYARNHNVQWLRIYALASNKPARSMYESLGFRDHEIQLEKQLTGRSTLDEGGEVA